MLTRRPVTPESRALTEQVKGMAEEELLRQCAPLISRVISHWRIPGLDRDDLRQEASLKLLWAQWSFDPSRGRQFLGYAQQAMENRMRTLYQQHAVRSGTVVIRCRSCGFETDPGTRYVNPPCPTCGARGQHAWQPRADKATVVFSSLPNAEPAGTFIDAMEDDDIVQRLLDDDLTAPAARRIMAGRPRPGDVELVRRPVQ